MVTLAASLGLALALAAGAPQPDSPACRALCDRVKATVAQCEPRRPETCDPFLAAAERLSAAPSCATFGYLECARLRDPETGAFDGSRDFLGAYLGALSSLASPATVPPGAVPDGRSATPASRHRMRRALAVLGSRASEETLDGDWGETWGDNVRDARELTDAGVLDWTELWRKRVAEAPSRTARASSELAPQGRHRYDAALAVDRREDTAWCAAKGAGDPWIEITVPRSEGEPPCRGLRFIPGHGRDLASFERNNRILAVRASPCARPEEGPVTDLVPPDEEVAGPPPVPADVAPFPVLATSPGATRAAGADCVRLTILKVARGRDDDTCISEIVPACEAPRSPSRR